MQEEFSKGEERLCERLRLSGEEAAAFVQALRSGACARKAVVLSPRAPADYAPPFACEPTEGCPWLPPRVFIPAPGAAVTAHEDYRAGLFYVLDLSSCWESAALNCVPPPRSSLDLCAAPGGKTMLMAARYLPIDHTANEVNAARRGILRQNIELCGLPGTTVTGLRPDQWGASGRVFDLLLVDAPCSGQSLLAKGLRNPGCLGAPMVNGNAKRQRGIMLAAIRCVAPGGHLLYTTCTYDPEENEKVVSYILRRYPEWQAVPVPCLQGFASRLADFPAYRMLPVQGVGAGGFACLLQRKG